MTPDDDPSITSVSPTPEQIREAINAMERDYEQAMERYRQQNRVRRHCPTCRCDELP
jgi:hypothetical protein